jgi:hypothetical protein
LIGAGAHSRQASRRTRRRRGDIDTAGVAHYALEVTFEEHVCRVRAYSQRNNQRRQREQHQPHFRERQAGCGTSGVVWISIEDNDK